MGEVLWVETGKRGIDTVEDVEVAIGDGVAWIWNLMQKSLQEPGWS